MRARHTLPGGHEPCGCENGKRDGFTCMGCEGSGVRYAGFAADWALVVAAIHFRGELVDATPVEVAATAYTLADGFGDFSGDREGLAGINDGWDWSHVRDSSEPAVRRMAEYLRAALPGHLIPVPGKSRPTAKVSA